MAWLKFNERGKSHGIGGSVPKFSIPTIARQWLQGEESIRQMLHAGQVAGEIRDDGEAWQIVNWNRDQGDETGAERQRRFRQSKKDNDSNALRNGSNVEERRGEEKRRDYIPPKPPFGNGETERVPHSGQFVPPTVEDCRVRAQMLGMPQTEGDLFWNTYQGVGWMVGNLPMHDWQAIMAKWKTRWKREKKDSGHDEFEVVA